MFPKSTFFLRIFQKLVQSNTKFHVETEENHQQGVRLPNQGLNRHDFWFFFESFWRFLHRFSRFSKRIFLFISLGIVHWSSWTCSLGNWNMSYYLWSSNVRNLLTFPFGHFTPKTPTTPIKPHFNSIQFHAVKKERPLLSLLRRTLVIAFFGIFFCDVIFFCCGFPFFLSWWRGTLTSKNRALVVFSPRWCSCVGVLSVGPTDLDLGKLESNFHFSVTFDFARSQ